MQDDVNAPVGNEPEETAPETAAGILFNWQTGVGFFLSAVVGTILARLADRPIIDGILVLTSCAAVCVLALRLVPPAANALRLEDLIFQPLRELLDSAGPAIVTISLDGRLTFINPAGERMLGYHAEALMNEWSTVEILAPGEGSLLLAELARICGSDAPIPESPAEQMAEFMQLLRSLPPSRVPGFDAQLRRKDGTPLPVTLHFSALRNSRGVVTGLVAIAIEQGATLHQDQDQRESQERAHLADDSRPVPVLEEKNDALRLGFDMSAVDFHNARGGAEESAGHTYPAALARGGELDEFRKIPMGAMAGFSVLEAKVFGEGRRIDDIDVGAARRAQEGRQD